MNLCAPRLIKINKEFSGIMIKRWLVIAQLKAEPFCTLWQLRVKRISGLLPKYIACALLSTSRKAQNFISIYLYCI